MNPDTYDELIEERDALASTVREQETEIERLRKNQASGTVNLDALVDRFLVWPVPSSVYPDGVPGKPGRTGTNLLTAVEARAMLEYVLRGLTFEREDDAREEAAFRAGHAEGWYNGGPVESRQREEDAAWADYKKRTR